MEEKDLKLVENVQVVEEPIYQKNVLTPSVDSESIYDKIKDKIEEPEAQKKSKNLENYSRKRVTLVAHLIGIKDEILEGDNFDNEYLTQLRNDKKLKILRHLMILRANFLVNYDKIFKEKKYKGAFAQLDTMSDYFNIDSIKFLKSQGIEPFEYNVDLTEFTKHISNLNQMIEERIDDVVPYVPEWIKWEYIRDVFVMQDCSSGKNGINYKDKTKAHKIADKIHAIRKDFYNTKEFYPYGNFLNWNGNKKLDDEDNALFGNILQTDKKFLTLLYKANHDEFKASKYVIDAKDCVKNSIYDFVEKSNNIAIFIDCENVDPYQFASTIMNLEEERISKIKKVILYDDAHTTNAWDILSDVLKLPIEHVEVERLIGDKSLVDHALSIGVTRSFFTEQTESVIIASSDSDFWSLIKYLPEVRFFVLNEYSITSDQMLSKLDDYAVPHCYMSDFSQDIIQKYKNKVLKSNLQTYIDRFNQEGVLGKKTIDDLIVTIFQNSGIQGDPSQLKKEQKVFYDKYIKKMRLTIVEAEDGKMVFKLVVDD